jgi:hypothetical protein
LLAWPFTDSAAQLRATTCFGRARAPRTGETMDQIAIMADGRAPWFVGWGTLALINAGLAQGKNRSGLVWFLVSLLLGPIATLVLVLLPKVRSTLF